MAIKKLLEDFDHSIFKYRQIVIFTDSMKALAEIKSESNKNKSTISDEVRQLTDRLREDQLTIAWIPGHFDIIGNEQADLHAKSARYKEKIDITTIIDIHEINRKIDRKIVKKWQKHYLKSHKAKWYKEIEPQVTAKTKLTDSNRRKEVILTRLRLGRCNLNAYKFKIKQHPTGLCDTCKVPETIEHYLINCNASKIKDKIEKHLQPNRNQWRISDILANKEILEEIYELVDRDL
jgi:hypothetical protein